MEKEVKTEVCVAAFPFEAEGDAEPEIRREYIKKTADPLLRSARFYDWKLLEIAAGKIGKNFGGAAFYREGDRFFCKNFCFSLSHSDNVVAAAAGDASVGVDVELYNPQRFTPRLAQKILNAGEKQIYFSLPENLRGEYLNKLWCAKEAAFKFYGGNCFIPAETEVGGANVKTCFLKYGDKKFILSVACAQLINLDVFPPLAREE